MFASFSSLKELWTIGILFHPMLWNLLPSTRLRTDWMTTLLGMDAYKAQLFKSIIYKYKYKYKVVLNMLQYIKGGFQDPTEECINCSSLSY